MPDRPIRVRFAPSPTGFFHVGSARTVLYNWIFARQRGGVFVLRVEDTDEARNRPEWTDGILSAMRWIGCDWDEGPFFQSRRADAHRAAADTLRAQGQAYFCDCTREALTARTGAEHLGYDGFCRDRGLEAGEGRALRFRVPDEGSTTVVDLIRGEPTFELATIEDFIILRGNGSAMFLLANVVDDIDMGITHVIRGEEHLSNTPKAQLLWASLTDAPLPTWAHVPVLVNEKRQKLSKRRDKVALEMYRDEGYLAEAMRNYLMTLGWAPQGESEIVPFEQIVRDFRLEDVNPSPAFFDVKKLTAFNGEYLRMLSVPDFVEACRPWLGDRADSPEFAVMAPLVQTRIGKLDEVGPMIGFLFEDPVLDEAAWAKATKAEQTAAFLDGVIAAYGACPWDADTLKQELEGVGERLGLKKAQVPVRVAVTGAAQGPPLYEPLELLGRDRVLARLRAARGRL